MSLTEIVVEGYDNFWKTVRETETDAESKKMPLIVIVKSTSQADGKSWCRDCTLLDRMLRENLSDMNVTGIIVKGKVGTLEEWLDHTNKFKTDETLRLQGIPTAFRWKNGRPVKRLDSPDILNPEKFKSLFKD